MNKKLIAVIEKSQLELWEALEGTINDFSDLSLKIAYEVDLFFFSLLEGDWGMAVGLYVRWDRHLIEFLDPTITRFLDKEIQAAVDLHNER